MTNERTLEACIADNINSFLVRESRLDTASVWGIWGNPQILVVLFAGCGGSTSTPDLTGMSVRMFGWGRLVFFLWSLLGEACQRSFVGLIVFFWLVGIWLVGIWLVGIFWLVGMLNRDLFTGASIRAGG